VNKLDEEQKFELKRRESINVFEGYNCPNCGYDFAVQCASDGYEIDGIKYPIISNEGGCVDTVWWTEDHMCPKCKTPVRYSDST